MVAHISDPSALMEGKGRGTPRSFWAASLVYIWQTKDHALNKVESKEGVTRFQGCLCTYTHEHACIRPYTSHMHADTYIMHTHK